MIIDSHVHVYPDKIAIKAAVQIGKFYDIEMRFDGSVGGLLAEGEKAHADMFLIHSVATGAAQVQSINNFIAAEVKKYPNRFIGFGAMHPDFADIDAEVERIQKLGLRGVKLHPDFQGFAADSEEAMRIYRAVEGKLPLLIHAGDKRHDFSGPRRIQHIVEKFPDLTVIAAHFGGWSEWDKVMGTLSGANLYTDTSSSFYALNDEQIMALIEYYGADHVFFGSDYPMWDAAGEIKRLRSLPLDDKTKDMILGDNLRNFLKL